MEKKKFSKAELISCRLLVIFFICIYMGACVIGCINGTEDLAKMIAISSTVEIVCTCVVILVPIVIIILLHMCIERYLYLFWREETGKKSKKHIYFSILLIIIVGYIMLKKLIAIPAYIIFNWNLLNNLHESIVVKFGIALLWVFGCGYCIARRDAISVQGRVKKREWIVCIVATILLLGITWLGEEYASKTARIQWYQVLEEYSENCDPTKDEYPSRN